MSVSLGSKRNAVTDLTGPERKCETVCQHAALFIGYFGEGHQMATSVFFPDRSDQLGKIEIQYLKELVPKLRELVREGKSPIRIELGTRSLTVSHEVEDELEEFIDQDDILVTLGIHELA
jgi:hypothetical protein